MTHIFIELITLNRRLPIPAAKYRNNT
jgi:hypothetical protein